MTQHHKLLVFLPSWWMLFAADVINHWFSCLLIIHKYPHFFTLQCQRKANVGWKRVPVVAGWRKGTFTYNISSGLITSTEELLSLVSSQSRMVTAERRDQGVIMGLDTTQTCSACLKQVENCIPKLD